jgi:hypothetical protein
MTKKKLNRKKMRVPWWASEFYWMLVTGVQTVQELYLTKKVKLLEKKVNEAEMEAKRLSQIVEEGEKKAGFSGPKTR